MMNVISQFATQSSHEKDKKIAKAKEMSTAMLEAMKEMTNSTNNKMLQIAEMEIASYKRMATFLAIILTKN